MPTDSPDDRPPVDYRALLAKYIEHVSDLEGVDFLRKMDRTGFSADRFTDDEWAELRRLSGSGDEED